MKRLPSSMLIALAFTITGLMIVMSMQSLSAQTPSRVTSSRYQYVGINQTIARVLNSTGRIEILEQRDAPGLSLLHPQSRPWEWREIRVRNKRTRRQEAARKPAEATESDQETRP